MMRSLRLVASGVAAVVVCGVVVGCDGGPPAGPGKPSGPIGTPVGAPDVQLIAFDSCGSALRELQEAAVDQVGPYGLAGDDRLLTTGAAAPEAAESGARQSADKAAPEHSTTNSHESAADEPDLVKTDGERLVSVLDDGKLRVVDVGSREVTATVDLDGVHPTGLFLDGDKALVFAPDGQPMRPAEGRIAAHVEQLRILQVDLTDGKITGDLKVEGGYVDARETDGVARVVIRSGPQLEWSRPAAKHSEEAATERNKQIVRRSTIGDWLPRYELRSGGTETSGRLVDCDRVNHPKPASGASMLTVLTLDVDGELDRGDPVSITGDGATVYGTGDNLYVADDSSLRFDGPVPMSDVAPQRPQKQRTKVYQFDVSGSGSPQFVASGAVDGDLLNQYSLSEHEGYLRIATTQRDGARSGSGRPQSESSVVVLQRDGDRLKRVGGVGGLGKGEQIYSVRFLGDVGYVVTFRQTDPLYRIDLSEPAKPRVAGELKITGYSSYLHPVGEDRLLGVGQEATLEGQVTGMQVSLFDIAASDPKRLAQLHVKGGSSDAEYDPHAFLYWPQRDLVVLPMRDYGSAGGSEYQPAGALVLRVDGDRVERAGLVEHPAKQGNDYGSDVRRSLVVGETLWTVSSAGAQANALDDLSRSAFVRFG